MNQMKLSRRNNPFALLFGLLLASSGGFAFTVSQSACHVRKLSTPIRVELSTRTDSFIDTELRGAAMRLHTKSQAPKEGEAPETSEQSYVTTREDYLQFLVDSKHVYEALEEIVNAKQALEPFRSSGLERTRALQSDISFMVEEYGLEKPTVGPIGQDYAEKLRSIRSIPEFMCHFYNFYFAHTAGGRMIGKQLSALLLNKTTLEFYKWEGDLSQIKSRVKQSIEDIAASWSPEEKRECVEATADAFHFGGALNKLLSKGRHYNQDAS